jgi:hypothetical protein
VIPGGRWTLGNLVRRQYWEETIPMQEKSYFMVS